MRRLSHRLAAWIVLVACTLSGVSPALPLVLCVASDGGVVLEHLAPGQQTPCEDDGSASIEPASTSCCQCTDILLPTQGDEPQVSPRTDVHAAFDAHCLAPTGNPIVVGSELAAPRRALPARPRPAPALASIRTIVLRV